MKKMALIITVVAMCIGAFGYVIYIGVHKTNNDAIGKALLRDAGR